jgi:hypothetical protein
VYATLAVRQGAARNRSAARSGRTKQNDLEQMSNVRGGNNNCSFGFTPRSCLFRETGCKSLQPLVIQTDRGT